MNRIHFSDQSEGRYDRHNLITWWDQKKVSQAKVIVAGAGALGNEVLKLLALIGVGNIIVIDFDKISPSNLARMVLFREEDIGKPKAQMAAKRLHEINPEVEITPIQGDLGIDLGLGEYRSANLVFGCLDSVNARWALNRKCIQAGVEWIDGGISDFHGSVSRYSPATGACYECTFTKKTYERFNQRYSCPYGLVNSIGQPKVPTTAVTASVIAAIQVQQGLMMIHNIVDGLQPGTRLMTYLKPFRMVINKLPYNSDCLAHYTIPTNISRIIADTNTTAREAIEKAREYLPNVSSLSLPFDLVTKFCCDACKQNELVLLPKGKVFQNQARCPKCGEMRTPEISNIIDLNNAYVDLTLYQLGIPQNEILQFNNSDQTIYLKFQN